MAAGLPTPVDRNGISRQIPILAPPAPSTPEPHDALLILHPGYGDASNVIFSLPCVDHTESPRDGGRVPSHDLVDGDTTTAAAASSLSRSYGVHHRTVLVAAQIVADNAFNGYLALDRHGAHPAQTPLEGILTERKYFFIVPGEDWRFPHDALPDFWPAIGPVEARQPTECAITRFPWALDHAHIVPSAQTSWFDKNGMARYGTSVYPGIDDQSNRLWLPRDLHAPTFDAFWFAFVPKPVATTTTTTTTTEHRPVASRIYSLHVLVVDHPMFPALYHDIQLPDLRGVAREYLFARFAQAVFIRVKPFINARKRRRISRFVVDGLTEKVVREELDGDALFQAYGAGRTRSASPSERKRGGGDELPSPATGQDDEWPVGAVESDVDVEGESRGRKRRRIWDGDQGGGGPVVSKDQAPKAEAWPGSISPERVSQSFDLS